MQLGLRAIFMVIAIVLFIVAAITNDGETAFDLLAIGLACVAAGLVVDELGVGVAVGPPAGRRSDT